MVVLPAAAGGTVQDIEAEAEEQDPELAKDFVEFAATGIMSGLRHHSARKIYDTEAWRMTHIKFAQRRIDPAFREGLPDKWNKGLNLLDRKLGRLCHIYDRCPDLSHSIQRPLC